MKNILRFLCCFCGLLLLGAALARPAAALSTVNMALGSTAYASSAVNGNTGALAIDGHTGTRWESQSSDPQYLYLDLGATVVIDRVKLLWETASGKDFTIEVSNDAVNWTTVQTVTNNSTLTNEYGGLNATGRYVRMYGTTRTTGYGYSLFEFEVYDDTTPAPTNIALNLPATASSTETAFVAGNAFDGNPGTRWGSSFNDGEWLYVDFQALASITQVNLSWEVAYASSFRLEMATYLDNSGNPTDASGQPSTWQVIYSTSSNTSQTNTIRNLSGTGRYLRMYGVTRATGFGFSLYEMQAFGSTAPLPPLPVSLTAFEARPVAAAVGLRWRTAQELNNHGFEVQRSADGQVFTTLAFVAGRGTVAQASIYAYTDDAPLAPLGYYRLKQVDTDGRSAYSPVVTVRRAAAVVVTACPNPATEQATIAWLTTGSSATHWTLTNALGQQVQAGSLPPGSRLTLDLRPYMAGTYYLTVLASGQVVGRTRVQKIQ